jgi:hypothetical protein
MKIQNEKIILSSVIVSLGVRMICKLWQKAHQMAWSVFGMGWVVYWAGGWLF